MVQMFGRHRDCGALCHSRRLAVASLYLLPPGVNHGPFAIVSPNGRCRNDRGSRAAFHAKIAEPSSTTTDADKAAERAARRRRKLLELAGGV